MFSMSFFLYFEDLYFYSTQLLRKIQHTILFLMMN